MCEWVVHLYLCAPAYECGMWGPGPWSSAFGAGMYLGIGFYPHFTITLGCSCAEAGQGNLVSVSKGLEGTAASQHSLMQASLRVSLHSLTSQPRSTASLHVSLYNLTSWHHCTSLSAHNLSQCRCFRLMMRQMRCWVPWAKMESVGLPFPGSCPSYLGQGPTKWADSLSLIYTWAWLLSGHAPCPSHTSRAGSAEWMVFPAPPLASCEMSGRKSG